MKITFLNYNGDLKKVNKDFQIVSEINLHFHSDFNPNKPILKLSTSYNANYFKIGDTYYNIVDTYKINNSVTVVTGEIDYLTTYKDLILNSELFINNSSNIEYYSGDYNVSLKTETKKYDLPNSVEYQDHYIINTTGE